MISASAEPLPLRLFSAFLDRRDLSWPGGMKSTDVFAQNGPLYSSLFMVILQECWRNNHMPSVCVCDRPRNRSLQPNCEDWPPPGACEAREPSQGNTRLAHVV